MNDFPRYFTAPYWKKDDPDFLYLIFRNQDQRGNYVWKNGREIASEIATLQFCLDSASIYELDRAEVVLMG